MKKILSLLIVIFLYNFSSAYAAIVDSCKAVGMRVAGEQGGNLKSATAIVENGKNKCLVIVVVPSRNGEKPRRVEISVPAG